MSGHGRRVRRGRAGTGGCSGPLVAPRARALGSATDRGRDRRDDLDDRPARNDSASSGADGNGAHRGYVGNSIIGDGSLFIGGPAAGDAAAWHERAPAIRCGKSAVVETCTAGIASGSRRCESGLTIRNRRAIGGVRGIRGEASAPATGLPICATATASPTDCCWRGENNEVGT
jgi:hypothetical protein